MSTNYNILLKSEKKLRELISNYLSLVHEIHRKLWKDADKYSDKNEDINLIYDNCSRRLKRSEAMENELLDECIWTISKDDPRANHLRFIISIIYSTKDISRSCEYAQSIAKIIVRNKLDQKVIKALDKCANVYLETIEKIIKIYKSNSLDLEKVDEIINEFDSKIEKIEKENRKFFSKDEIVQYQVSQINRLSVSTIERIQSIFSSILFSKTHTITVESPKKKKSE